MPQMAMGEFRDKDDALHPCDNEEYYEWWYFDARFDNGYSCVATLHWRNAFIKPHIPTVQVFVYAPDGQKYIGMAAVNKEECRSSLDKCDVTLGKNFARKTDNEYVISLHTRKIAVDLTYHRKIAGWKQGGTGYLFDDNGKKQGWVIAAPRSDVEGVITIDDLKIPVEGRGYHDKNWGNSNIYDCFSGWYWGRLYDPQFTLIYYWLFPVDKDKRVISRLFIAQNDKPIMISNDYNLTLEKEMTCELTGKPLPARILLQSSPKGNVKFNCVLDTTGTVERDKLPKIAEWDQYHWRFLGDFKLETTVDGVRSRTEGKAIHEHLLFR